jgi:predicted enzyme related to lactoylglutathione lyase
MTLEAELTIFTADIELARSFYADGLGFQLEEAGDDAVVARRDGLAVRIEGGARPRRRSRRWTEEAGVLVNLRTDDFQGLYDELRTRGVQFLGDVTEADDGGRYAGFSDPDGNLFELSETPPEVER